MAKRKRLSNQKKNQPASASLSDELNQPSKGRASEDSSLRSKSSPVVEEPVAPDQTADESNKNEKNQRLMNEKKDMESFESEKNQQAISEPEGKGATEQPSEDEENDALEGSSALTPATMTQKVIDLNEIRKLGKKIDRSGLVYLSRIPYGMGPSKVKHLLSKWGAVGRIYLARDESIDELKKKHKKGNKRRKQADKHQSFAFKEGWVEFIDKKVARRVAEMLNTRPIGGKSSDRFHSELWSLTYLPKFKWTNLSDQMAVERRIKEQLVRNSLQDSMKAQDWYLTMVDKHSTNQKIHRKDLQKNPDPATAPVRGKTLHFKQRELPPGGQLSSGSDSNPKGSQLKSVLDGLL